VHGGELQNESVQRCVDTAKGVMWALCTVLYILVVNAVSSRLCEDAENDPAVDSVATSSLVGRARMTSHYCTLLLLVSIFGALSL
jgi:hypothetical protein